MSLGHRPLGKGALGQIGNPSSTTATDTYTPFGAAVMPASRLSAAAWMMAPTLLTVHQAPASVVDAPRVAAVMAAASPGWQVSQSGQYHPEPAAVAATLAPSPASVPTPRIVRVQPEAPRLLHLPTANTRVVEALPAITPTATVRPQAAPWKALESPAVAAPQSTVTQGDVRPRFEAPGWQVSQSGQYHTPGAAAPQSFVTLGTVLPMAETAGWQVIQASQLHEITAAFIPPVWAVPALPSPRSHPRVASPLDTFVTIAPQSTVTAGTVTPTWGTARRFAGTAALFEQAAVVAPYVPELATRLSDATTRRPQPALWRPVDVAAAILDTMLPQSPWAMPVVRWTPRAQPLVWQAINGAPIPPTPGLPGHATTGHAGLGGSRNLTTGRPVWARW